MQLLPIQLVILRLPLFIDDRVTHQTPIRRILRDV